MNNLLALGILMLTTSTGWTQTSFTLSDAKAYALENHLSITNAENDNLSAHQRYIEIRGMGLPQVAITGDFNNFLNLPVQVVDASFINPNAQPGETIQFRAGTDYSASGTLQATQLLFNGSYIIGLKAAGYLKSLQATSADITKEDVIFNVIQSYQLASVAKANTAFTDSMVIITEELIKKQNNYLELGLMKQEDMDQLNYSLLTAKDAQLAANLQYENALNLLKFSMGFPMENTITITDNPNTLLRSTNITNGSIKNNLTYTLLEQQVALTELEVKNNQFANLPTLNAYFQHTYNAYRNEFNFFANEQWFPQTVWGLQLNVPVFSGFTRKAVTAQSKIKLLNDQNNLLQMEQTLQFQLLQTQSNLAAAQSKYNLQQENVGLARSIYEKAITKEQIGEGNSIIVTQKYNQLIMSQAQYTASLIELFQARLDQDKIYNNILSTE